MIKAELIHNPYLLETKVLFNNRPPRINSLVEKYQEGPLQSWIKKVPSIFYDEMNGYDFELEFSGTTLDFSELQSAFADAGVSDDMVHLFHKNELDEREVKLQKLDQLLDWLKLHPNKRFDNDAFRINNKELLEGKYPFLVFQKHPLDASALNGPDIEVEYISEFSEVAATDLSNTPILIFISEENRKEFQTLVKQLLARTDVLQSQIFFMTHAQIDREKARRVVIDLGFEKPQFISEFDDPAIKKYMDLYPRSEYILEAIKLFRSQTDYLEAELTEENQKSAIANKSIYEQIDELGALISCLKDSLIQFNNRDNIDMPMPWIDAQVSLVDAIGRWRIRKTKIVGTEAAQSEAYEFDAALNSLYHDFLQEVSTLAARTKTELKEEYCSWYTAAGFDTSFTENVDDVDFSVPESVPIPRLSDKMMAMKEENYVMPKEDLFGKFFKTSAPEPKEPVLEITFYYQKWREYAIEALRPYSENVLQNYYLALQEYEKQIATMLIEHLETLISEKTEEKELVASNLSEDEQKLQNDNDWLAEFTDQLKDIERG